MSLVSGKVLGDVSNKQSFAGNGSTTVFTLSFAPTSTDSALVYLDGLYKTYTTDYTISGTSLTFVTAPATGQLVEIHYQYKS